MKFKRSCCDKDSELWNTGKKDYAFNLKIHVLMFETDTCLLTFNKLNNNMNLILYSMIICIGEKIITISIPTLLRYKLYTIEFSIRPKI